MLSSACQCLVVCLLVGAVTCADLEGDHIKHTILSPRMEYEQWKPIGRGDPLRNDPTYDYVPPALDKVRYWHEPSSPDELPRDHRKKSEVLMLGISSKKPSIVQNVRRESVEPVHKYVSGPKSRYHPHPPHPPAARPTAGQRYRHPSPQQDMQAHYRNKYEMNDYKAKEHQAIPMTILVPPPPPPPAGENIFQQSLFKFPEDPVTTTQQPSQTMTAFTTSSSPGLTVQEANLIYQSSSLDYSNRWTNAFNRTEITDYSGWAPTVQPSGPTGPHHESNSSSIVFPQNSDYFVDAPINDNHSPLDFDPPEVDGTDSDNFNYTTETQIFVTEPTFAFSTTTAHTPLTHEVKYTDLAFDGSKLNQATAEMTTIGPVVEKENPLFEAPDTTQHNIMSMLGPMFEMPLTSESSREATSSFTVINSDMQQTRVYPHQHHLMDMNIEFMQTMQPPPISMTTERYPTQKQTNFLQNLLQKETRPIPMYSGLPHTAMNPAPVFDIHKYEPVTTTEAPIKQQYLKLPRDKLSNPTYIIIQGHSKVKTYSSKNKAQVAEESPYSNEILQQVDRFQVKHLHQPKELKRNSEKIKPEKLGRNLKKLVADGVGTIDIQEANLGIGYDVSNGEDVPVEIYRKGFVEAEDNDFVKSLRSSVANPRAKRQIDLEDIVPIDEDTIENYVYNYLKRKSTGKGISAMIASLVTSDAAEAVDEIEDGVEGDR